MSTITITKDEKGYSLVAPGVGCTGKNAEDVLVRAAQLKGVRTWSLFPAESVHSDYEMGELVEGLLADTDA